MAVAAAAAAAKRTSKKAVLWRRAAVRSCTLVEHIVPINRGANNINMLINILSINRGQPPEGGGFGGFVANMLINI